MRDDDIRGAGGGSGSHDFVSRPVRRQILGGRYAVLKELGRGASGVVMLCRRKEDHTLFAVKEIHTGQDVAERRRIYEEGKLMLNIPPHPSIVRIEEVSESRDSVFLVIEYVPDGSLHSVVYTDDVLDTQERQRDARRERESRIQLRAEARDKRRRRHRRKVVRANGGDERKEKSHSKISGWGGTGTDQWDQMSGLRSDEEEGSSMSPTTGDQPHHRQGGGGLVDTPLTSGFGDAGRNALMGLFAQDSLGGGSNSKGGGAGTAVGGAADYEFDSTADPPPQHIYPDMRSPGDDDVWGDEGVEEAYGNNRGWGTEGVDADQFGGGDNATTPTDDLSSLTHSSDPRQQDDEDHDDDNNQDEIDDDDFSLPLLSEITITKWMSQLANAVDYLHHLRIAHRDIKLENILVSSGGAVVKICDFGVAATIPEVAPPVTSTHTGIPPTTTTAATALLPPRSTMLGLKPQSAQSSIRPLLASKAVVPAMAISGLSPRRQQIDSRGGVVGDSHNKNHNVHHHHHIGVQDSASLLHSGVLLGSGGGSGFLEHATVGTPQYMPPEICDGRAHDLKCDVWSLGVTFYELCARVLPFEATNMLALMHRIMEEPAAPIPTPPFSPHLNAILLAMLSKEPSRRPTIKQVTQMFQYYRRCRTQYEQQLDEDMLRRVAAGERVPHDMSPKPDDYAKMPFDGDLGIAGFTPAPQPTNFRTLDEIMAGSSSFYNNASFPAPPFSALSSVKQHPHGRSTTPPDEADAVLPEFSRIIMSNPSSTSNVHSVVSQQGSRGVNPAWPIPPPLSVGAVMLNAGGGGGGVDSASCSPTVVTNSSFIGISPESARILAAIPIQPTTSAANTPRRPHQGAGSRVVSASSSGATRANSGTTPLYHQEPTSATTTTTGRSNNPQLPPRPPLPAPHPSTSFNPTSTSNRIVPGMSRTAGTAEGLAAALAAKADVLRELQDEYHNHHHNNTNVNVIGTGTAAVSGSGGLHPRRGESPLAGMTPRGGASPGGGQPSASSSSAAVILSKPQTAPLGGSGGMSNIRGRVGGIGVGGGVSPPSSSNRIPFANMQFATPDGGGGGGGVLSRAPSVGSSSKVVVNNNIHHLKRSGSSHREDGEIPLDSSPNFNNNGSGILDTSAHLMNTANTVENSSFEMTPLCSERRGGGRGGGGVRGIGSGAAGLDDMEGGSGSDFKRNGPESVSHYELHSGDAASEQERRKNNNNQHQQLSTTNNVFLHSGALAAFLSGSDTSSQDTTSRFNSSPQGNNTTTNQNLQSTLGSTYYTVVRGGEDVGGCSGGTMPYGRGSRPSGVVDTSNAQNLSGGTMDDDEKDDDEIGTTTATTMSNGCTSPSIRRRVTDTQHNTSITNNLVDSASKSSAYSATSPEVLRRTCPATGRTDGDEEDDDDGLPPKYQDDEYDEYVINNTTDGGNNNDDDEILRSAASPYSSVNPRKVNPTVTNHHNNNNPATSPLLSLQVGDASPGGVTKSLQALLREENERDERDLLGSGQLPHLRGPTVRGVRGGSKTTSFSFEHNQSVSSVGDVINGMPFNAAVTPRSSRSSRGGSYAVGEQSHSVGTSPVGEPIHAQPFQHINKQQQGGKTSPLLPVQNARTWHLPTMPASDASILSPTSTLVVLPSNSYVMMSNNNSFTTLTSSPAGHHPPATTTSITTTNPTTSGPGVAGLAHIFELDNSGHPGSSSINAMGGAAGGGSSTSKLVRKTSLVAAGVGGVGSGHHNVADASLVSIPVMSGSNLHHPLITGRSLLSDFNDEAATTPLPDESNSQPVNQRFSPSKTGDITVEDVEDVTGSSNHYQPSTPTTTNNTTTHQHQNNNTNHPNSPSLTFQQQQHQRPPSINPSSLLPHGSTAMVSSTGLLSTRTTTTTNGGGGDGGLEGSQIDESGVLIRWGSTPGMLTSQHENSHPPPLNPYNPNNFSHRHSSSGGATTNPLVSPSLGNSQRHDGGAAFGAGGGDSGGGDSGGFSPHQSGSGGPQTGAGGFSIPSATFVVEGVDSNNGVGGIRRRGTGASNDRGGAHGGERRVSTLWGLDGPLSDHHGNPNHHTHTSSSSMSHHNITSPTTAAISFPPHGDEGYSPTRRYETASSPKTPAVHRGRRTSDNVGGGGGKVVPGGCCCTIQ